MIPYIRSIFELKALTKSREDLVNISKTKKVESSTMDSGQRKRYLRSIDKTEIELPNLPKTLKRNWIKNKGSISKLINKSSNNNQLISSIDVTISERQSKGNKQDVA